MKKLFLALCLVFISSVTQADTFERGLEELNRGEFNEAHKIFSRLSDVGFAPAQYQLAMIYKNGYGRIQKNLSKTFKLLTLSAEQNFADAQFALAVMYTEGEVVPKDLNKAFTLTKKSADKKLGSAQFNLAVMYYKGQGVSQNFTQAANWYMRAAKQNNARAQFNLALLYFEGKGVDRSTENSYIWNTIAAYNNYKDAAKSRDMDAHQMSKMQVTLSHKEADRLYFSIIEQQKIHAKKRLNKYVY
jgi:uncharacterized protein